MKEMSKNQAKHTIDPQGSSPLYYQVKEHIKVLMKNGQYQPGQKLPTEEEMCKHYKVSRITVRRALIELAQEGLLSSMQGSGTYVNDYSYLKVATLKAMVTETSWVAPLQQAVEILNRSHPGRHIKLDVAVVGRPQLHFKIIAAVAQGEAPDLALIDSVWIPEFANLRYLQPLDELDAMWVQAFKADLFPIFVEKNSYGEHFYGVQTEANVAVLWYRADFLEQEGLTPPRTWDELVRVTLHFKQDAIRKKYGLSAYPLIFPAGLKAGENTTYHLLAFIHSTGEKILDEGKINLGPGTLRSLNFLHDLIQRHQVTSPEAITFAWDDAPRMFAQGVAVMAIGGSYAKSLIQQVSGWDQAAFRKKVGFVPIPAGPKGKPATTAGGMVYGLFRQSKYLPEALEVLKHVASPELMKEFCIGTDRKPTRISVAQELDPERDWFLYQTAQLLNIAQIRPSLPEYAKISEQLRVMLENVVAQRLSAIEAVQKAQSIIDALTGHF